METQAPVPPLPSGSAAAGRGCRREPGRSRGWEGTAAAVAPPPDAARFCRKCFLTAIRESGTHCPLCRGSVTKKERTYPKRALDVENSMKKASGGCRCCEKQVRFSWMRQHYKTCKKYQDEYGVSSIIPNLQISQDSTGNSRSDAISDNGEMSSNQILQGETSGHPTFKCPLCQEANFTRQRLLDHCNNRHLYQIVPVICPICVSLPWADTNQVTRNLVSHLNLRHRFDYGEFVNLQLDEEAQYQNAVQESCHVNF
ncbi:E3 ubiquitin-protein ligase RNF138 isoform X2 [Falco rusticolus]|nr:E3 ubiquitin-protein ligase RNF138 isoform X2 [Falco rusticolus]